MFSPGDPLSELSRIENERTRIDREVDRLLGQLALPAGGSRRRKRIRRKLRRLTGNRSRLDDEEAELRRRESDLLRIYHGRHPAGSTASSSRETGVEEHAGEVRSSEPVGTSTDLSKFEALALNDTPHIPESADRLVMHVDTVKSGVLDPAITEPSAPERKKPSYIPKKYWPPENQGDISFARRKAEKEYQENRARSLQARGQYSYASKDEIVRNANKWMREEVMVAFKRYIASEEDLKDIKYEFEKLDGQCLNVENYFKIFHHFNFTVKIKKCGSADWTPITFFAEVISILETKHYVCYPLDQDENGQCGACRKQGMFELRHPSTDIFECGNEDTRFPYYYEDTDSDESYPEVGGSESDYDMG